MTIANKLETINSALSDIKNAIVEKGVTPSGDITTYSTAINNISGGMDTVEATNYTENAISTGDKVWINKEGTDYKLVDFYKKYYNNFNVVGSPSIDKDSGYAGNFGSSSYLRLPEKFNPGNNTWEAVTCITTLSSIRTNKETHFFGCYTNDNSFVVTLKYVSGLFYLTCYLSSNGSTFDISSATNTIPFTLGTKTWVKLSFTGTSYVLSSSTDGVNWTDTTITSSLSIAQNKYIYLGACWAPGDSYLQGSVDLSQSYIKIGNDIWWTPAENIISGNITGDTLTGIADDNFTASSTTLNVDYPGSYVGTVLTSYVFDQTQANSTVTIYKNKSFECLFKVKKIDGNSDIHMLNTRNSNSSVSSFYIRNGSSRIWATAYNGSSEQYGSSYTIPDNNKWFYVKAYYDPSNLTVTYTWSYDKITWNSIWSYTFSSSTWFNGNISELELIMYIGCRGGASTWTGLTDLSECYFKVDDQIVWDGTTFTPGGTGDVYIGDIIEPTISRLEITPSTSSQTFDSNSVDGYKPVIVSGVTSSIDANIIPENIKKDITILGVIGTHEGGGSTINNQNKTVSAETSQKYVTFDSGYTGLGTVTINAVDSSIDNNIISGNIIEGKSILGVPGSAKAGANGYNFKVQGNPTITQNGIASGFSGTDKLIQFETPKENISSLEMVIKFTLPSQMEDGTGYICVKGFQSLRVVKDGSSVMLYGGQVSYISTSINVTLGETYWVKVIYNGTNFTASYSTDGISWTQYWTSGVTDLYTKPFIFGNEVSDTIEAPFTGQIDLSETYVKVNNKMWWTWKTMSYPVDIDLDGYYEVDPSYTGFSHINVHVLDAATEMLQEINSGSGTISLDESE